MPTNLSIADSSFPQLTKQQSTDEKFDKIQSYLYMLLESLRFSLSNLDKDNFNDAGLDEISDMITEPVYAQISDVEGNVTSLALMLVYDKEASNKTIGRKPRYFVINQVLPSKA